LESAFLDSFTTAQLSTSYLMCEADVTWQAAARVDDGQEPPTRADLGPKPQPEAGGQPRRQRAAYTFTSEDEEVTFRTETLKPCSSHQRTSCRFLMLSFTSGPAVSTTLSCMVDCTGWVRNVMMPSPPSGGVPIHVRVTVPPSTALAPSTELMSSEVPG